ncbi:MAG: phosphatase PAP2 family protein [Candidatus Bathyarchaeota archaeon]|nr:phosphatase PAP2 family protein [Candidatus Bathyarchaeota archaeon]
MKGAVCKAFSKIQRNFPLTLSIFAMLALLFLADLVIGDSTFFLFINREIANPALDFVCLYILLPLFSLLFIIPLATVFLPHLEIRCRASGLVSLLSGFLSYGIGSLIKCFVMRPRPFDVLPARVLGFWSTATTSFPSTTTMLAFGIAIPVLMEKPRYGSILVSLSFLVGFFVVYSGFHFPGDVIAGAFLSIAIALFMNKMKTRVISLWKSSENEKRRNRLNRFSTAH